MMNKRYFVLIVSLCGFIYGSLSQVKQGTAHLQPKSLNISHLNNGQPTPSGVILLTWKNPFSSSPSEGGPVTEYLNLSGGQYQAKNHYLPNYFARRKLKSRTKDAEVTLENQKFEPLSPDEVRALGNNRTYLSGEMSQYSKVVVERREPFLIFSVIPLRKNPSSGKYEKLVSFTMNIKESDQPYPKLATNSITKSKKSAVRKGESYASQSVLASGNWVRIGVVKDGMYKLDYHFFKSAGIDTATLNPADIRIYGNGGAMLPSDNSVFRIDDLEENAIWVKGQNDASFKKDDYVLFYGQSTNTWSHDSLPTCGWRFHHTVNLYADTSYYFLTTDLGAGKRVDSELSSKQSVTNTVTSFDDYAYHELDAVNLVQSGQLWYGEELNVSSFVNISFNFPNLITSVPVFMQVSLASRCGTTSYYTVTSGATQQTIEVGAVSTGCYYCTYALPNSTCYTFNPNPGSSAISVGISKQTPGAIGWIYYAETNVRRQLSLSGPQMEFRDVNSVKAGNISLFSLASSTPISVWDVTNPQAIMSVKLSASGKNYNFTLPTDSLKQFIAISGSQYDTAFFCGKVANQNLHGMPQADLVIVSYPGFFHQAQQLGEFHASHDSLKVAVVTTTQVYNEFSSGKQDPIAIRDLLRMFYSRAGTNYKEMPKYLLLLGDGSYDPKNRVIGNTNYVVAYESYDSYDIIGGSSVLSSESDDYFGIMDSTGLSATFDDGGVPIDIGVGRFPVNTTQDAQIMVDKVITYETGNGPSTTATTSCCNTQTGYDLGSWRNVVCFIAHDGIQGDGCTFLDQTDQQIIPPVAYSYPSFNINKIYFDAYPIVQTPGGARYPEVNAAIDNQMDQGLLIMNYDGHGGPVGLGVERVLDFSDIYSWTNTGQLPLFFVASCSFGQWDNPAQISGGQLCVTLPTGGDIGIISALRESESSGNESLNTFFYDDLYSHLPDGSLPRIGDLFREANNQTTDITNSLAYSLLGDPAVRLAYPQYKVHTTAINSKPVTANTAHDTLRALQKVTITGIVSDNSGNVITGFNGALYPTIYDKQSKLVTLDNGGWSCIDTFDVQRNKTYSGFIAVKNGKFSFSFIVPKDIMYNYGWGKISYYAQNTITDAYGYDSLIVGGSNPHAHNNGRGPAVRLYLNDSNFAYDGMTNQNPDLFAIIFDSNGINTTGASVGHDITAVLDNNTQNTYDLTNYFQPALNSYQRGTITYPFSGLSSGQHTLSLRVWNVFDNTTEVSTEFTVVTNPNLTLQHVLNYPNPFTTHTQFYFEINEVCDLMDVQILIFTVSGKIVKNIVTTIKTDSFRSPAIDWDGRDDYGSRIANGVYIYHLRVRTADGATADTYQKLVIL